MRELNKIDLIHNVPDKLIARYLKETCPCVAKRPWRPKRLVLSSGLFQKVPSRQNI